MAFTNGSSRIGAINQTGDVDALFLKVFSGEVLTTFEETNVMMPLHRTRTISSGKTAQFPTTGVAAAAYHTPGESLFGDEYNGGGQYLSKINHAERTISIDGILTASAFLNDIDEAKNHYEVRSIYSTEIGRQLAYHADRACIHTVIAGARNTTDRFGTTYDTTGGFVVAADGGQNQYFGTQVVIGQENNAPALTGTQTFTTADGGTALSALSGAASGATSASQEAANFVAGAFTIGRLMDQRDVPQQGRVILVPPRLYYDVINLDKDAINRDYGNDGNGSVAQGVVNSVAGFRLIKTNHIPTTDQSSVNTGLGDPAIKNDLFGTDSGYVGNFEGVKAVAFQTEAIGTLKLLDLAMESEYFMERMGTLMMAKYAMGHGVLREECCYTMNKRLAAG